MADFSALAEQIKRACGPVAWQQGLKLADAQKVETLAAEADEIELQVHAPGAMIVPTVVIYPNDNEWECDCRQHTDNCAHVAAAIIALQQAQTQQKPMPRPDTQPTYLEYRFHLKENRVTLDRCFVGAEGKREPLKRPILAQMSRRNFPMNYRPQQRDVDADRSIGRLIGGHRVLPSKLVAQIISKLDGCNHLYLNDDQYNVSSAPMLPQIEISPAAEGVELHLLPNPDVNAVILPGIALVDQTLHPLGQQHLCGETWEKLPRAVPYTPKDLAELVVNVLPRLEKDNYVDIKAKLPVVSRFLRPTLIMNMNQKQGTVDVLPELVYGAPPHVKVVKDRIFYIQGSIPRRNREEEFKLVSALREDLNLVVGKRVSFSGRDAWEFVERARTWSETHLDASQHTKSITRPLIPSVSVDDNRFDIAFGLLNEKGEPRQADASNVMQAWKEGLGVAPLSGGGFASIPQGWLDKHGDMLLQLLDSRQEDKTIPTACIPTLAGLCDDLDLPPQPCFTRLKPLLEDFSTIPSAKLPGAFEGELRDYQKSGVDWISFLRDAGLGAVLADDMGLGKTVQALCSINSRTLVVCPTSVMHNWQTEARKFRPDLKVNVFHGPNRSTDPSADLTITNYALLRIDRLQLEESQWGCIILDEAQNIKNPSSQAAKAAFALKADFKLAMSGTPVENRIEELWSIFNFANPGLLGGHRTFQREFSLPISMGSQAVFSRLKTRIKPFILRRIKEEVAPELPERTDILLECELSETEREIYETIRAATQKEIVRQLKEGAGVMQALEQLLRLRQAACHPSLLPGKTAADSAKLRLLMEELEGTLANDHKALIFSQWTSFLDLMETQIKGADINYNRLDGRTRDRQAVVEQFQNDDNIKVMLISLKAGGTGLNLTAADHVFIMDPWWNPAVEQQAADRTHRIGQDKPVCLYRIAAKDTVEQKILLLQDKKRELANATLEESGKATSITRDDLLFLLEG